MVEELINSLVMNSKSSKSLYTFKAQAKVGFASAFNKLKFVCIAVSLIPYSDLNESEDNTHQKYTRSTRGGGVRNYSFGNWGPHATFQNPRTTPSGRKVRKEKKEKNLLIVATMFSLQHPRAN